MRIDRTPDTRRHERYELRKPVRAKIANRGFQGEIQNISGSGAALLGDSLLENDLFVELHLEGLDFGDLETLPGRVVRTYEKGFAVQFEIDEKDQRRLAEELRKFRKAVTKRGA